MNLAVWREERLAAAAECRKNDKGLNDGLHWLVWLYCHKGGKGGATGAVKKHPLLAGGRNESLYKG